MPRVKLPKRDLLDDLLALAERLEAPAPPSRELVKEFGQQRAQKIVDQALAKPDFDPVAAVPLLGVLGLKGLLTPSAFVQLLRQAFRPGGLVRAAKEGSVFVTPIPVRRAKQ